MSFNAIPGLSQPGEFWPGSVEEESAASAITFVAEAQYTFTGTADTDIRTTIPSGIQAGDLIVCCFGNIGSAVAGCTMNNGWTKIREDTSGTNCYFLMAAKIATAGDVSNAGTDVSIGTKDDSVGQGVKTSQSMAYRGTGTTVGTAILASNMVHESSPADQTINTGSASSVISNQWYVCFFNMAATGDATASSWSSTATTFRGDAEVTDTSATSSCAGYDSGSNVAVQAWSRDGTWSGTATRLNAGIMILEPATVDGSVVGEVIGGASTSNQPRSGVAVRAGGIG